MENGTDCSQVYLALAKIKLLMEEYEESDSRINYIIKEIKKVLNEVEIPSKYLIAEGFDDIYKKARK
jgi:hypothetical protein